MGAAPGFWIAFAVTLLLLAVALVSGLRGKRRLHLFAGPAAVLALAVTVVLTEQLMRGYAFPAQPLRVHLWFAKGAGVLGVAVVATGLWLWRRPTARRWHRFCVLAFAAAALLATGTGIWAFTLAEPK